MTWNATIQSPSVESAWHEQFDVCTTDPVAAADQIQQYLDDSCPHFGPFLVTVEPETEP